MTGGERLKALRSLLNDFLLKVDTLADQLASLQSGGKGFCMDQID
ncbi:hypothetical protein [Nocardia farcinica]|nr:hypothetical protein [Nocardia farcinica]